MKKYTASLSQSQGRPGWSIIFRHPVRRDLTTGKPVRVRQGLETQDLQEAERLKTEMDVLLTDERFWEATARTEAERRFDDRVVRIFYHRLSAEGCDFLAIRDRAIPLPSSHDSAYRRVLLLGTTGAGKTTLVRQLIGTGHDERFPSTSTAKTTIHDIEIVLSEAPYKAIVTFMPQDEVMEDLTECISAAVLAAHRGAPDSEICRRLLNHVNQRFRLSYTLGSGPIFQHEDEGETESDDDLNSGEGEDANLDEFIDLKKTNETVLRVVDAVKELAALHCSKLKSELNASNDTDERVIDELFEEEVDFLLRDDEDFHNLADTLMDEIVIRFDALTVGEVRRSRQSWPESWYWETPDRDEFVRVISKFSSNYAVFFGSLLTPLVNGIRVSGPFAPKWSPHGEQPKLVLLDGEGLGHNPSSSAAVSTSLYSRMNLCDAVLLVDNAMQPMQAAAVGAMKELVSSGNSSKMLLAFTHFDQVTGDNLPTFRDKARHVLASAENVLASLGQELGPYAERGLRQRIESARFFLGNLNTPLELDDPSQKRDRDQLLKLVDAIKNIVKQPVPIAPKPIYDRMNLVLAVKSAAEKFQESWQARLGLKAKAGIPKEHWTRIKALSRRLATPNWQDYYDSLMPIADFRKEMQDQIYLYLQNPVAWENGEPTEAEKEQTFNRLADSLKMRIQDLSRRRIREEHVKEWQEAYSLRGPGSTFVRAKAISTDIYQEAAPVPEAIPSPDRNEFLRQVLKEVEAAAEELGAKLI